MSRPGTLMTLALDPSATGSEVLLAEAYAAAVRNRILALDPLALGGTRPLPQVLGPRWWPADPQLGGALGAVTGCASANVVAWASRPSEGWLPPYAYILCLGGGAAGYVLGYMLSSGGELPPSVR